MPRKYYFDWQLRFQQLHFFGHSHVQQFEREIWSIRVQGMHESDFFAEPIANQNKFGYAEPTEQPAEEGGKRLKTPQKAEPAKTAEQAKPAEPAKPVEPAKPAQPAQPAEPAKPAEPAQPAEPAKPAEPAPEEAPEEKKESDDSDDETDKSDEE